MTNDELKEKIIKILDSNHMWINALALINPTDEIKIQIGQWVIDSLKNKENLLPSFYNNENGNDEISEYQKLTPVFYCRINAS